MVFGIPVFSPSDNRVEAAATVDEDGWTVPVTTVDPDNILLIMIAAVLSLFYLRI